MFHLTKQEKIILVFLSLTLAVGLGISTYKKGQGPQLNVQPNQMLKQEQAERLLEKRRQVNINSLELNELSQLPGIGEKIAANIIAYHQAHGPFKSKEELLQVEGIGEKKLERLKDLLILE